MDTEVRKHLVEARDTALLVQLREDLLGRAAVAVLVIHRRAQPHERDDLRSPGHKAFSAHKAYSTHIEHCCEPPRASQALGPRAGSGAPARADSKHHDPEDPKPETLHPQTLNAAR